MSAPVDISQQHAVAVPSDSKYCLKIGVFVQTFRHCEPKKALHTSLIKVLHFNESKQFCSLGNAVFFGKMF